MHYSLRLLKPAGFEAQAFSSLSAARFERNIIDSDFSSFFQGWHSRRLARSSRQPPRSLKKGFSARNEGYHIRIP